MASLVAFNSQDAFSKAINEIEDRLTERFKEDVGHEIRLEKEDWEFLARIVVGIPPRSESAWVSKAQSREYHRPGKKR